jgi:pimeloyl-ACP methyl ester carboxylesterase
MLGDHYEAVFGAWQDVWVRGLWRVQVHCVNGQARALNQHGTRAASGSLESCIAHAARCVPPAGAKRAAVLLHGLWNCPTVMAGISQALAAEDWTVANIRYPSRRLPLTAHGAAASRVARALAEDGAPEIAFIGHSLGGLVARTAMAQAKADGWQPGPLVLIGSPARGSAIAGRFHQMPGYKTVIGACGDAVTPAGAKTIPLPVSKEVLVIAGGTGSRGYNPLIAGDDDGLIAVAETRMPGHETAFKRIQSLHKSLPLQPGTIASCCAFLHNASP